MFTKRPVAGLASVGFLLICSSTLTIGQSSSIPAAIKRPKVMAPHRRVPPLVPANKRRALPPGKPGSMVGGIWMTDANFKSELHLHNVVETSPVTVTPVLHLSNGTQYSLPAVQLAPAGTAVVDISSGLQNLGIASYATLSGWVEVQYNWSWNPLCATVHNVDAVHSLLFNYDLHTKLQNADPGPSKAETVEGLWWKQEPNVTGFVALANTSSAPLNATLVTKDAQSNPIAQHTITISPQGMKMVSLSELQSVTGTTGGITVTYSGSPGDLIVNGGLEDQSNGYSANIPFDEVSSPPQTNLQTQPEIAELGLMVGPADPMMAFPAGTIFTPYSVLRDTSNSPVTVTPTLWWMASGAAQSSTGSAVTIGPGQSQSLDVSSLLLNAGLKNFSGSFNLLLDVQGSPGSLLRAAGSVDQSNTYVFEVAPRGVVESAAQSLSYWSTGNGDDTMVTVWNPSDEAQDFIFRLYFNGGHYGLPIHLAARETRTLNVSEIIQTQTPDAEGNIIPAGATQGSAKLVGSTADNQIILVAMDAGTYNVKKATCGQDCHGCDGWVSAWIDIDPFSVQINQQVRVNFLDQWDTGFQNDLTGQATWSGGSGITVNSGLITGTAGGSTFVEASDPYEPVYLGNACVGWVWYCPLAEGVGAGAGGNVYDPTPVVESVSPDIWNAGASNTLVTIGGTGFGTAPVLSFSDTTITVNSYIKRGDTGITASITIPATAPNETVTVTVTSTGYNGSGFLGGSGQSSQGSNTAAVQAATASISLSRQSLATVIANGSPTGGLFSYTVTPAQGTSVAGIQFASGVTASSNPNTTTLTDPANPSSTGSPSPGGLASITAKYVDTVGMSASDSFTMPTFGMSCYYTALQSDWGTAPNSCSAVTIKGVKYSGTVTNTNGLKGVYCSSFIAEVKLQGSAVLNTGADIQYSPTTNSISTVSSIKGADGSAVVAGRTVARDRSIIPTGGVHVDLDGVGTGLLANDTGNDISGYRIDLYKGAGSTVCKAYNNIMSNGDCTPGNSKCPASAIQ